MRESTVEAALVGECRLRGLLCLKITPTQPGVPDRLILTRGGGHLFVEVKAPGRRPREAQRHWHARLTDMGHRVCVVDHPQVARDLVAALDDVSYTDAINEPNPHSEGAHR